MVKAIRDQAGKLMHISNLYHSEPTSRLAQRLVALSFPSRVFFGNSGSEANEAAIKFARRIGNDSGRTELFAFERSFHGRTMGVLSLTWTPKYREPFAPLLPDTGFLPWGDLNAIAERVGPKTAAVLVEPVQGEGGLRPASIEFLQGLRRICTERGALLIVDEIQCGFGRTGKMFAYQHADITPDILTVAKPLGGGLPMGATLLREEFVSKIHVGDHGSTFGGNPLVCAAAFATIQAIEDENILANVNEMGNYFEEKLVAFKEKYDFILDVRGKGLLLGMELAMKGADIVAKCMEKGVIINCTHDTVLRFLPPLNVTSVEIDKAVAVMDEVFQTIEA